MILSDLGSSSCVLSNLCSFLLQSDHAIEASCHELMECNDKETYFESADEVLTHLERAVLLTCISSSYHTLCKVAFVPEM